MRLAPYPDTRIVTREESVEQRLPETDHATCCLGLHFDDAAFIHQPTDFRHVGLHRTAGNIFGVEPAEEPPRLSFPDGGRPSPNRPLLNHMSASRRRARRRSHTCNRYRNDVRLRFDHKGFLWCPRHAGTPRRFECTRRITVAQVITALKRIPGLIQGAVATAPTPNPVGERNKRIRS